MNGMEQNKAEEDRKGGFGCGGGWEGALGMVRVHLQRVVRSWEMQRKDMSRFTKRVKNKPKRVKVEAGRPAWPL